MYPYFKYGKILFRLGWHQISQKLWSLKNDDTNNIIYLDFKDDKKGIFTCNDKDNQPIPNDIIEEWSEIAIFRKKQLEIDKGIPQETSLGG